MKTYRKMDLKKITSFSEFKVLTEKFLKQANNHIKQNDVIEALYEFFPKMGEEQMLNYLYQLWNQGVTFEDSPRILKTESDFFAFTEGNIKSINESNFIFYKNNQPSTDIHRKDIVKSYFYDLGKSKLLTREEEVKYAKMMESHNPAEHRYARERLISCNQRLAVSVARRYLNQGVSFSALIQEAIFGMIRGIDHFD